MLHLPIRVQLAAAVVTVLSACAQQPAPVYRATQEAPPPPAPPAPLPAPGAPAAQAPAAVQTPATAQPAVAAPPAAGSEAIDPQAISALEHMGAYLRTLRAFEVAARSTTENVMDDGMKLQFDGRAQLKVRRPDRLRVDIFTDRKQRQIYYDGKAVTVYGPRVKYYATVAAPPTLGATIQVLTKKYGIELPLADLFYWGTDQAPLAEITAARYIGPATVDGKPADQYAFRQEGVDWQVWIQQGKTPLPLKMAITSREQPAAPTHSAWLHWNLAPRLSEATFAFKPPPGAMKIVMQRADGKIVDSIK
ncbi:MAG TPA: DUF2092 domain-containing protein [Telluria sp.]